LGGIRSTLGLSISTELRYKDDYTVLGNEINSDPFNPGIIVNNFENGVIRRSGGGNPQAIPPFQIRLGTFNTVEQEGLLNGQNDLWASVKLTLGTSPDFPLRNIYSTRVPQRGYIDACFRTRNKLGPSLRT
jgi:hypothetical protein